MVILECYLNLPKNCFINSRIPKKAFTDNPEFDLKKEEKEILRDYVDNMYFQYSLKPGILNIPSYEDEEIRYEEIQIIKLKVSEQVKEDKACNIVQKYIPYPMLILIEHNEYIKLNLAIKKINKVQREKLSIEEMIYTDWINLNRLNQKEINFLKSLDISRFSTNNLFKIYEGFINSINSFNLSKYREEFKVKSLDETLEDIKLLEKIESIENEITTLKNSLKKESNMGTKVELNVRIKKLQKKIEQVKSNLT